MKDKSRIKPPKFNAGYVKHDLTVIAYDGRRAPAYTAKERHYYRVQCKCGTVEILDQQALNAADSKKRCIKCQQKVNGANLQSHRQNNYGPQLPRELDFARLVMPSKAVIEARREAGKYCAYA